MSAQAQHQERRHGAPVGVLASHISSWFRFETNKTERTSLNDEVEGPACRARHERRCARRRLSHSDDEDNGDDGTAAVVRRAVRHARPWTCAVCAR